MSLSPVQVPEIMMPANQKQLCLKLRLGATFMQPLLAPRFWGPKSVLTVLSPANGATHPYYRRLAGFSDIVEQPYAEMVSKAAN